MKNDVLESLAELSSGPDVSRLLQRLFAREPVEEGALHPTAVWVSPKGELLTLKIEEGTPKSRLDFFLLNFARARADAIVTTGKILREEPDLSHGLQGDGNIPGALGAWRRERLGKESSPLSLVLTSGQELDFHHPFFSGPTTPVIFTGTDGRQRLAAEAGRSGIEVIAHPKPSLPEALDWLQGQGMRTVSIEAGPSTSRELYRDPIRIDELLLSIYRGEELSEAFQGGEFLSFQKIRELLPEGSPAVEVEEPSGVWSFSRHLTSNRGMA